MVLGLFFLLDVLCCSPGALAGEGNEVRITNSSEFISFADNVNKGTSYSGTTVFLDSDLSLSGVSEPIGKTKSINFRGTFDGQGHTISDLKISLASQYTALFGYSTGLTIKNVILDGSCSVTNAFKSSNYAYAGGIISYCYAEDDHCNIENSVNMASITFTGNTGTYRLYLGGIVGKLNSFDYNVYVKNCANYGSLAHSGTSYHSYIGGILGDPSNSDYYKYFQNCINYGAITHNGTTSSELYLGGIMGHGRYVCIENCVSAGIINIQAGSAKTNRIGSIVGWANAHSIIKYCYYASNLGVSSISGFGTPTTLTNTTSYSSTEFTLANDVSIGEYAGNSLLDALNAYVDSYELNGYSKWLLNKDGRTASFTINGRANPIKISAKIILLPSLADDGSISFDGWYENDQLTTPVASFEITKDTSFYGKFGENTASYTISFDTRGGPYVEPKTVQLGTFVSFPNDLVKGKCSIATWENEYGERVGLNFTAPQHDITLYALWKCTRIGTAEEFKDFSKILDYGIDTFKGSTVYLDTDLSLSGVSNPLSNSASYQFSGTFDGQGHVFRDFRITLANSYLGLFGRSYGLTIRNVVLDDSCSVINSFNVVGNTYVGGIIGYCESKEGPCNIENNVNMANVTFSGSTVGYDLSIGGIFGRLHSVNYAVHVKNCANYGSITNSGKESKHSFIGGIAGHIEDSGSTHKFIRNCLNYGKIAYSGSVKNTLTIGGIVGTSTYIHIENCMNAGEISVISKTKCAGNVVGVIENETHIHNCYYIGDSTYNVFGDKEPTNMTSTPSSPVSASTAVNGLNSQVTLSNSWDRWALNPQSRSVSFKVNSDRGFVINSQVILLPGLVDNDECSFSGWFLDDLLVVPFVLTEVESDTVLYGMFCGSNYTVALDVNGGNPSTHTNAIVCNETYRGLVNMTRRGYSFDGWFTDGSGGEKVEPGSRVTSLNNHTLYAHWTPNKYTVTFDVNGGNELGEKKKVVTFNSTYGALPTPVRPGWIFINWANEVENVTSETVVDIAGDHTIRAQWEEVTKHVEIVFESRDITDDSVEAIVKQYTDANFTILRFEDDETDSMRIIVKFTDTEHAESFVVNIRASDDELTKTLIKTVGFIPDISSFSPLLLLPGVFLMFFLM